MTYEDLLSSTAMIQAQLEAEKNKSVYYGEFSTQVELLEE